MSSNSAYYITYVRNDNHSIFSVSLPLSLEWKVNGSLFLGADCTFSFPLSATTPGYLFQRGVKRPAIPHEVRSHYVSRSMASLGLHVKYNIINQFYLEGYGNIGNIFSTPFLSPNNQSFGLGSTKRIIYGIKFGVYY